MFSPLETKPGGLTSEGRVSRDEEAQLTLCYHISVKSLEKLSSKCHNFQSEIAAWLQTACPGFLWQKF